MAPLPSVHDTFMLCNTSMLANLFEARFVQWFFDSIASHRDVLPAGSPKSKSLLRAIQLVVLGMSVRILPGSGFGAKRIDSAFRA